MSFVVVIPLFMFMNSQKDLCPPPTSTPLDFTMSVCPLMQMSLLYEISSFMHVCRTLCLWRLDKRDSAYVLHSVSHHYFQLCIKIRFIDRKQWCNNTGNLTFPDFEMNIPSKALMASTPRSKLNLNGSSVITRTSILTSFIFFSLTGSCCPVSWGYKIHQLLLC